MFRFGLLLGLMLVGLPSYGQERIFRASAMDFEQNNRLDVVESRLSALESTPTPEIQVAVVVAPADPITGFVPSGPTVLMITNGSCHYCDVWWARYEMDLRQKGWHVKKQVSNAEVYPTFRVYDRKTWKPSFAGTMTMDDLRRVLGMPVAEPMIIAAAPVSSGRYSTSELQSKIRSMRPNGWRGPVYADVSPQSSAKRHLVGNEHGFSKEQVAGLSQEEALILHDLAPGHGNKISPYRSRRQPVVAAANGCPNGQCAKQSQQRSSLFGFRR